MNALSTLHGALRPNGLLLDIHPAADHRRVVVRTGGRIFRLGQLDESQHIHELSVAEAALRTFIDAGQFVIERETRFRFISHFDDVESWLTYTAEHSRKVTIPPPLVARAREVLPPGAVGEVRTRRQIYAARLRRG